MPNFTKIVNFVKEIYKQSGFNYGARVGLDLG